MINSARKAIIDTTNKTSGRKNKRTSLSYSFLSTNEALHAYAKHDFIVEI